jgi:hypothetical protein
MEIPNASSAEGQAEFKCRLTKELMYGSYAPGHQLVEKERY